MTSPSLPLTIRHSSRAKRLILRISPHGRGAELVVPHGFPMSKAQVFLDKQQPWLERQYAKLPSPVPFVHGAELFVLGERIQLHHLPTLRGLPYREGNTLYVTGLPEHMERRTRAALEKWLHAEILVRVQRYTEMLSCTHQKIRIKETTSRWGSCARKGELSFSWRLIFAPPSVLDYIVAHEVAHIKERNHSPRFWAKVRQICPDFEKHRNWLYQHQMELYRYGGASPGHLLFNPNIS